MLSSASLSLVSILFWYTADMRVLPFVCCTRSKHLKHWSVFVCFLLTTWLIVVRPRYLTGTCHPHHCVSFFTHFHNTHHHQLKTKASYCDYFFFFFCYYITTVPEHHHVERISLNRANVNHWQVDWYSSFNAEVHTESVCLNKDPLNVAVKGFWQKYVLSGTYYSWTLKLHCR